MAFNLETGYQKFGPEVLAINITNFDMVLRKKIYFINYKYLRYVSQKLITKYVTNISALKFHVTHPTFSEP